MIQKYAALIALITIAPLYGAGESMVVTGPFGPGFVPFSPEAKSALYNHLEKNYPSSEWPMLDLIKKTKEDHSTFQPGFLGRRLIAARDPIGVKLLVQVTGDCVGYLSERKSIGLSYMSYAAGRGDISVAEVLQSLGASLNAAPGERCSPLESAVKCARLEMVRWLISNGVEVDDPKRQSILMFVGPKSSNDGLYDLLLKHGAKIERLKKDDMNGPE